MFADKTGKKFGSAYVAKRRDAEAAKKEPVGGKEAQMGKEVMNQGNPGAKEPAAKVGTSVPAPEEQGSHAPAIVAEHGKAHTIHIAHDHKAKKHHVMSTHEDGLVHESEYGSPKEAHDTASQLAGNDMPAEGEAPAMEAPEADGFSMPKLA